MKRFLLGVLVGCLMVPALWDNARPMPPPPPMAPPAAAPPPGAVSQANPHAGFRPAADGRQSVWDNAVPIVPGTRVTEAEARPPRPAPGFPGRSRRAADQRAPRTVTPSGLSVITGRLSATEDRALEDVRKQVDRELKTWLEPAVGADWPLPTPLRESLVRQTEVRPVEKDLEGEHVTLFEASQTVDLSPRTRTLLVEAYHREIVVRRLAILAGVVAFILSCLAALAGYIRADEATKGYYTNRLRLVSAAGAGAAGVLIYRLLA
jgi:hypothetical protein